MVQYTHIFAAENLFSATYMIKESIIISHIRPDSFDTQSNEEHQEGVAKLAHQFADSFGMAEWGRVLGLLHDKGKEKNAFQQHIRKESGLEPNLHVDGDYNHAYVGALVTKYLFPKEWFFIANPIMGHHRGLYDDGDFKERMKQELPQEIRIDDIKTDLKFPTIKFEKWDLHHLERMLYSCLVDADYLDTESFMMPEQNRLRGSKSGMAELYQKLQSYLEHLNATAADTEVNKIRRYVQQCCVENSSGGVDFYSLTVPTGGGKTLSSVLWALRHAAQNQLRRIIIAIPYTSIIVQTAHVLQSIFGEENVLEHHSSVNNEECGNREMTQRLQLATENWDYPIVVTTNVQLFESLFSNSPSHCRKLHNIAKSVLIFDEVQTLPLQFLRPIVDTFKTLKNVFGCSILFTTASQPTIEGYIQGTNPSTKFEALPKIHEIIPTEAHLHEKLRRVHITNDEEPHTYDEVASMLSQHHRVLCIVNTRKDAKELYERLPQEGLTLHLSRMMCPAHVKKTIAKIKDALKNNQYKTIRVIATQLIEAGVDIDFPIVYRQEAGLDSILQAAGRCNREGKLDISSTFVFSLKKEHNLPSGFINQANNARLNMGNKHDWFAPETMSIYFHQLYSRCNNFDDKGICDLLYKKEIQFEEAAHAFRLIDDATTSVYVGWKEGKDLIEDLKTYGMSYSLMKKLSQYGVNVRQKDLDTLKAANGLVEPLEGVFVLNDDSLYDDNVGLVTKNLWLEETIII